MKKIITLLLAITLVMGISLATMAEAEPTKLVFGSRWLTSDEWLKYDVIQDICTRLNISLEFISYDDDTFSLMLAGGDMPDIVQGIGDYSTTILNNKLAMNLYPLMEEYAPNMLNDQYAAYITMMQGLLNLGEDELYFIAPNVGPEAAGAPVIPSRGYIIRWDYYKEIGAPEISNDDDYIAAIKAMQELHPTTEDGRQTYGVGVERSLGDMGGYRASFAGPYLSNTWTFGSYKFKSDLETSELINAYIDIEHSSYWIDMGFYNKLYREGLFDIDSFTMTYDEWDAKVAAGVYMGVYAGGTSLYNTEKEKDPDTLAGFVSLPTSSSICFSNKLMLSGNYPSNFLFIPANCEKWETAMAFLNELFDPDVARQMYSGKQGVYWDYDENNKPVVTAEALELYAGGNLPWNTSITLPLTPYSGTATHPDGAFYHLFSSEEYRGRALNALQKDYCEHYGVSYMGEAQQKLVEAGKTIDMSNDRGQAISSGVSDIPTDIKRIMDACNDICERAMPDLIMADSDEQFASVQAEVLSKLDEAGVNTAWEWAQEAWATSKAKVDVAFKQAKAALAD
jgi:putative aldouronate transport system substrate-binding protein